MSDSSSKDNPENPKHKEPKVTGIGGIFFKAEDPGRIKEWYAQNLGIKTDRWGTIFASRNIDRAEEINYLQWSPFTIETDYFNPSAKEFMINYRVQNIEALVEKLKENGVEVLDEIQTFEYGKFVHILDNEGNKLELWEPVDRVFTDLYKNTPT